ncbi:DNA endonuclease SmrA [Motiliproteus sp. SC1-56]|uniref:DNA endonuclease SmrA n=1 Tax=Motiliproteus sp. SC1-56 TaxID=2799565 RepID=UPI001A8C33C7|nr:DNA endonuclease SmrA [Motiliproteus sp. SC1-56]
MASEEELFRQAVADVRPLAKSNRAALRQARTKPSAAQLARRVAAEGEAAKELGVGPIEPVHPFDPIAWHRDGVQDGVYRNLRLGRYSSDARLELIGLSVPAARDELLRFIGECLRLEVRTALIHHGRGKQAQAPGNLLRSYLTRWLPALEEVLAFHSAQPAQGGLGATYLLLRKSPRARQDNLERHQKRRS